MSLKITLCSIVPPKNWGDMAKVRVELGDSGKMQDLFDFFSDELSFDPSEFVGLTVAEALELKRKKDEAYLRS